MLCHISLHLNEIPLDKCLHLQDNITDCIHLRVMRRENRNLREKADIRAAIFGTPAE